MAENVALRDAAESLEQELTQHRAAIAETMKLINALHRRMGQPEPYKVEEGDASGGGTPSIGPDEFFDYGRPSDATEALLKKLKRATPIDQVVDLLKRGGFKFATKEHAGALRTAIGKDARLVKFEETDTVGLLDWYPKRKRARSRTSANGAVDEADESGGDDNAALGVEQESKNDDLV